MIPQLIAAEKDYLIINKPAGLIVHLPRLGYQEPTLVDWLIKNYPEVKNVGDEVKLRPGIVHRLDKEASGLMVIARNQESFIWLKSQFQQRKVLKEYLSLVYGQIKKEEGEISLPLNKGAGRTKVKPRGKENQKSNIKKAVTQFEVLERFQHYTLIKVRIETGRTHQIRAHFANYGHSIVGDQKYCHSRDRKRKAFTKFVKSDRLFLHSHRLGFYDLNREWQEYRSALPEELRKFLDTLYLDAKF
ncbi:MAG: RNA pseudouridine synthase [Patescibacteria group bacterium]